jgi:hypothetical protein
LSHLSLLSTGTRSLNRNTKLKCYLFARTQLSLDFLDANGKPFSEELGGVEKSTKAEANGKQDHAGTVNIEHRDLGDKGYQEVRTSIVSGKKGLRRKLLSTQDDIGDDELEEAVEGSAGTKKPRKTPSTSIVNPLKTLLRQGVSELAVPASSPQSACLPAKQELESCKQPPYRMEAKSLCPVQR